MTNEEAIELIKVAQAEVEWSCPMDYASAFDLAIKALEQQPCEDCISRQAAIEAINKYGSVWMDYPELMCKKAMIKILHDAPPVNPQPKTRRWIMTNDYYTGAYGTIDYVKCSCCGEDSLEEGDYCPNCGAKMVEPQESEE